MNQTACDCTDTSGSVSIPVLFFAVCLSATALISSFFTHGKFLALQRELSMDGHKLYGKIDTMSA